ncbi:MAG: hypothetical protein LBC19_08225 [Tannerella sp.]|jgi:hypothetical protein|nr:hypothetical protein [Tannerella sp.]
MNKFKMTNIPNGRLASETDEKKKRQELARKLLNGEKVKVGTRGNVTENRGEANISTPPGKLAFNQWYDNDPQLLEDEIEAMQKAFPDFELIKLDDGRLAWLGELNIGIVGNNKWQVSAIYQNNHPQSVMGSSVHIHLLEPTIEDLIEDLGWRPTHLLRGDDGLYLCTAEASNINIGEIQTSAASVMAWAVKWLMAFELVLMGDLSKEKFNEHGGI